MGQPHKNTTARKHLHDNYTQPHNNHSTMHNHMTTQTTTHDHIQPPQQPHHHSHNVHLDHIIHPAHTTTVSYHINLHYIASTAAVVLPKCPCTWPRVWT